ncbi:MAG: diguanylate cyclase [Chloroflexi bacterium]|nr:diguanylate cyclase [Chloroflexota bacterium]
MATSDKAFQGLAAEDRARLLEFAFENAAEGMLIGEPPPSRKIIYANEAFCRLTGWSRQEVIGRPPDFLDGPDTDQQELQRLRTAAFSGEPYVAETLAYRKDGSTFHLEQDIVSLRGADGEVAYWYTVMRDVTERRKAQERLVFQALHDALTGLPNRLLLADRLQQSILTAQRGGGSVALFFVDLDGFKAVNDTFGHSAGDQLLHDVGNRFKAVVRESDTVARIGGDEFAILLPGCGPEPAHGAAAKLVQVFATPFDVEGDLAWVKASVGVAVCPQDGDDAGLLMRRADRAMYQAKDSGSGYRVFGDLVVRSI